MPRPAADEPRISLNDKEINMMRKAKEVFGDQELAIVTFRLPRDLFADLQYICARRGEQHRVVMAELVDQFVREHYEEVIQTVRPRVNVGHEAPRKKVAKTAEEDAQ